MFNKLNKQAPIKKDFNLLQKRRLKEIQVEDQKLVKKQKNEVQNRVNNDMLGSKFRILNELLYTNQSKKAMDHFKQNPKDFEIYHKGFQLQTQGWSDRPVDLIVKELVQNPKYKNKNLMDLGCGEAELQETLDQKKIFNKICSFDLMAQKSFVQVADISKLPLKNLSMDVAVFCLALMGVNYLDFLIEAGRVLNQGGTLIIAEVNSRFISADAFVSLLESLGYKKIKVHQPNSYFTIFYFKKQADQIKKIQNIKTIQDSIEQLKQKQFKSIDELSQAILKPCIYKRR